MNKKTNIGFLLLAIFSLLIVTGCQPVQQPVVIPGNNISVNETPIVEVNETPIVEVNETPIVEVNETPIVEVNKTLDNETLNFTYINVTSVINVTAVNSSSNMTNETS